MSQARLLAGLGVLVFAAFWFQHARSPFLRIENDVAASDRVAAATGLDVFDVMALRELLGLDLSVDDFVRAARQFADDRVRFGSADLAVIAATGHRETVRQLLEAAGGDVRRAEDLLRSRPEAIDAVRVREVRERFRQREAGRRAGA